MENPFITMINEGKISNSEELKQAYYRIAKRTHPDMVGSNRYVDRFIMFSNYFTEAKEHLKALGDGDRQSRRPSNFRLIFFQELCTLCGLELPGKHLNAKLKSRLKELEERIKAAFLKWRESEGELFGSALSDYLQIRAERPHNDFAHLRKPLLLVSLLPLLFSLSSYHLSGQEFYLKQFTRNLKPVVVRLEEESFLAMKRALFLLAEDIKRGPAILGG